MSENVTLYEDRESKTFNDVSYIKIGNTYWVPKTEAEAQVTEILSMYNLGNCDISGKTFTLKSALDFTVIPYGETREYIIDFSATIPGTGVRHYTAIKITTGNVYYEYNGSYTNVYYNGAWAISAQKTITIDSPGGLDANNAVLYYWLTVNDIAGGGLSGLNLVKFLINAIAGKYKDDYNEVTVLSSLSDFAEKFLSQEV